MRLLNVSGFAFLALLTAGHANNLQITNVSLTGQNTTNDTWQVKFDISWENSWRTSTFESNFDAAWVFVKFRIDPQTQWNHAQLNTTGFLAPGGSSIDVSDDLVGAFIFRTTNGIGNVSFSNVQLQWNYGLSGVVDNAILEVSVHAIEMVYIPGGSFVVGDGTNNSITGQFESGNFGNSYSITSENALTLGGTVGTNLSNHNNIGIITIDDYNYATTQSLPAAFPKGFNAFYIQKYEISQGQYTAFLNHLTPNQATARFPGFNGQNGHTIANTGAPPNVYIASSPDRSCNYLGWADLAAYADWSGLRPLSELEYEKACRGSRPAVEDELSWGNPYLYNMTYTYANNGLPNESISNPGSGTGNAIYILTRGIASPRRNGIIAASAITPSRQETGSTYYGVGEMSGNVWETVISTGSAAGRGFIANHGNGIIGGTGISTVGGWPSVTTGAGTGVRGGGHPNSLHDLRISDRRLTNINVLTRFSDVGGRLVRSSF